MFAIIIGSNLSRALTGNSPFLPTLIATTGLVLFYWIITHVAARWHRFSWLVKGGATELVCNGELNVAAMRRFAISVGDIEEAMRRMGIKDLSQVSSATLERNGNISVVCS